MNRRKLKERETKSVRSNVWEKYLRQSSPRRWPRRDSRSLIHYRTKKRKVRSLSSICHNRMEREREKRNNLTQKISVRQSKHWMSACEDTLFPRKNSYPCTLLPRIGEEHQICVKMNCVQGFYDPLRSAWITLTLCAPTPHRNANKFLSEMETATRAGWREYIRKCIFCKKVLLFFFKPSPQNAEQIILHPWSRNQHFPR